MNILNANELLSNSLILDLSPIDFDKIREIKEKFLYKEIMGGKYQISSELEKYQIQRWSIWFKTLDSFEERKKKFELDCVEELTKIKIIECVLYELETERWI